MKNRILSIVALVALSISAIAFAQDDLSSVYTNLDDHEWQVFIPDFVDFVVISGDPETGPSTLLLRTQPGFIATDLHKHTSAYTGIVVKGQHKHWDIDEDRDRVRILNVGDTFYQPAEGFHYDGNPSNEEALLFMAFHGPFDSINHDHE